ncbi:MAG TPA: YciI family protein [Actinomycetota bacterium]|jgi:uncharacterized protein YciI|nr:YciI family protein [Actinomycetota bacterium]
MSDRPVSFVVEALYAPDARERRGLLRREHLDRLEKLAVEGSLVVAGAFEDLSASLLVFDLQSEESVRMVIETDVYWRNKIWTDYTVRRFNRVFF